MATYYVPRDPLFWFVMRARRVLLSACAVALVSCGGGQSGPAAPADSVGPTLPAPMPAPGTTPAQLVVGTAQSIDIGIGESGNPISLRVARSANGDGFAVWLVNSGRGPLWVNRYSAATAAWGSPIKFERTGGPFENFEIAVDASGNAVLVWQEGFTGGLGEVKLSVLMSVRFDAGAGAWATPVQLSTNAQRPRVASDATGAVLAVYQSDLDLIHGRFFDPASGTWQPVAVIEQNRFGSHGSSVPLLDGNGNALVAFDTGGSPPFDFVASNYFSRSTGDWVFQAGPDECEVLGVVPGSPFFGGIGGLGLATTSGGDFLLAWQNAFPFADQPEVFAIRSARFTSSTRTWSEAQTLVPGSPQREVNFRPNGFGSDAAGNALLLWTENDGMRTVLKAMRVDPTGAASSAAQVIDGAVGGSVPTQTDPGPGLGVDPLGNAIAIWQQFEGDGSRNNIAINRFDGATGTWGSAVFAEAEPGNAISPRVSAGGGGQALLGWIQREEGVNRVKALLQPLTNTPSQ